VDKQIVLVKTFDEIKFGPFISSFLIVELELDLVLHLFRRELVVHADHENDWEIEQHFSQTIPEFLNA
jgi:hypothetical protein